MKDKTVKIKVARVPWEVQFKASWHKVSTEDSERAFGITLFNDHVIRVAGDAPVEKQNVTLIHEILHALVEEYGITPFIKKNGDHDEKHIDLLAIGLCEVLESMGIKLPHIPYTPKKTS